MAAKTAALNALNDANVEYRTLAYSAGSDHFGDHAAEQLDFEASRMLKTLVVTNGREFALCCVPVTRQLSLKKAAHELGWKNAEMADPMKAQKVTGYVVGGISPLGQKTKLMTLISASVQGAETICVSAGARGLSVELAPAELVRLTDARFVDLDA